MDLRRLKVHARSPWFTAPLCIGIGAAGAFLLVGVPSLSTEAAASWFGGVGGWLGALATFVAVLVPYRRERDRAKFRARLTLTDLLKVLERLGLQLDTISSIRATLEAGDYHMTKSEAEAFFQIEVSFPTIDAEPEMESVILALEGLRREIETWRRATHPFAFGAADPIPPRQMRNLNPILDSLTDRLHERIARVENEIFGVEPVLATPIFDA